MRAITLIPSAYVPLAYRRQEIGSRPIGAFRYTETGAVLTLRLRPCAIIIQLDSEIG